MADRARVSSATFQCSERVADIQAVVRKRKADAITKLHDTMQKVQDACVAVTETLEKRKKALDFEVSNSALRQQSTLTGHAKSLSQYQQVGILTARRIDHPNLLHVCERESIGICVYAFT